MITIEVKNEKQEIEQKLEGRLAVGAVKTKERVQIFAGGEGAKEEVLEILADAMVRLGRNIFKTRENEEADRILWKVEKKILKRAFMKTAEVTE